MGLKTGTYCAADECVHGKVMHTSVTNAILGFRDLKLRTFSNFILGSLLFVDSELYFCTSLVNACVVVYECQCEVVI